MEFYRKYELIEPLPGEGTRVFRAKQATTGREVAVHLLVGGRTPENEALDRYFLRLGAANEQFREEGIPGWLTDRGEVLIVLGPPNEMIDPHPDFRGRGRTVQWVYDQLNLILYFVDDAGFGRLRLDPGSRSEFDRIVNRLRSR